MSTVSVNPPPPPIRNFYPHLTGQNNVNTFVEVSDKVFFSNKTVSLRSKYPKTHDIVARV